MARDRDHAQVAANTRRDAQRLLEAWDRYVESGAALVEAMRQCESVWPSSVADVAPVVCQLRADHLPGDDNAGHRHRMLGSQVVVTW